MPDYWISAYNSDLASQAGRLVYVSKQALWVSDRGAKPRKILEASGKEVIERPVLSSDGMQIAYSLWSSGEGGISQDIWTINADGSDNRLVVADTRQYLKEASPFRMVPAAWSAEKTVLYLNTTSNSEATPKGLYVADLKQGTVEKAKTPPVILWDIAFLPDRRVIAYHTFQWVDQPGYPVAGPSYTLNFTDLVSGETRVRFESQEERYAYLVWSPEGANLAYLKSYPDGGQGIWVLHLLSCKDK